MKDRSESDGEVANGNPSKTFHHLHGFLKGKTNGRILSIEQINEGIAEACVATNLGASTPPSGLPTIYPSRGEIDPE
ncbi:hypothetical protein H4S14_003361 [Agrobacterium vitis]|nr:hypothetical protein [Agrobacterium vitis]MBE1439596.1 hypothetical protein [Agrobacterium vitis]